MTPGEYGYEGLRRALELGAEDVASSLEKAGQREIAGGGGSVVEVWRRCLAAGGERCVVCNAVDAGLQGGIAQFLLDRDAHAVLEGLLIAAYAVEATQAYLCVDAGDAEQIATVTAAVDQMKAQGLPGQSVLGADSSCEIIVVPVPASLVLREETALLRVLEGRQAIPYLSDPSAHRLGDRLTAVHGAETLAQVSAVFRGPSEGGEAGAGTRLLAVRRQDEVKVVQVPLGTTLRTIVEETAGIDSEGPQLKAVRFGGPTGRFFAGPLLDTPLDHEGLGMLEVVGAGECGVELARDAMCYLSDESCGACVACREGTRQLADMLDDIVAFEAQAGSMELLSELVEAVAEGSICSMGKSAAALLLSTMEVFPADYRAHLDDKRCLGDQRAHLDDKRRLGDQGGP